MSPQISTLSVNDEDGNYLCRQPHGKWLLDKQKEKNLHTKREEWRKIVTMNHSILRWKLMSRSIGGENVKTQQETSAVFFEASQRNLRRWLPRPTKTKARLQAANITMTCTLSSDHVICLNMHISQCIFKRWCIVHLCTWLWWHLLSPQAANSRCDLQVRTAGKAVKVCADLAAWTNPMYNEYLPLTQKNSLSLLGSKAALELITKRRLPISISSSFWCTMTVSRQ